MYSSTTPAAAHSVVRIGRLLAISISLLTSSVKAIPADNTFEIVGVTGVSAQTLFIAQSNKVYVVDKTEKSDVTINGHTAFATEYDLETNTFRAMDVRTNCFCSGTNVLGNGTWVNVGGNQAVGAKGVAASPLAGPYGGGDGGYAVRSLNVCDDSSCDWTDDGSNYMTTRRWYPTLETLPDGSLIILGGDEWGGFVNSAGQNNPTYEFYPKRGGPVGLQLLLDTLPANLYPLTWLLPSGSLFIQAGWGAEVFDWKNNIEYRLQDDMPYAIRCYPGSAATAMMPLLPSNNWTATIMFCGGTNLGTKTWTTEWDISQQPAEANCVSITPDRSTSWINEEPLPTGRVMGNWIYLPDGRLVLLNGVSKGVAGYGNEIWRHGESYSNDPLNTLHYFDRSKPKGQRFSGVVATSEIDRMYHSSATLLPDGSIFSAGSNPNADFIARGTPNYKYPTEYRAEKFYPDYYTARRPTPLGLPKVLSYGGSFFNITLSATDLGPISNIGQTRVTIVRPGASTHGINMGQRFVQLDSSYTVLLDGSAILHVSQLPPNAAILAPGPALLFVVVNGVPSHGVWIVAGNGVLGEQPVLAAQALPPMTVRKANDITGQTEVIETIPDVVVVVQEDQDVVNPDLIGRGSAAKAGSATRMTTRWPGATFLLALLTIAIN